MQSTRSFLALILGLGALAILPAAVQAQPEGLTYERWNNLPGTSLEVLRRDGINARLPDHTATVPLAETPANVGDNYGARLRGTLIAPATGDYTFFVAGDDNVELWLSHDPAFDTTAPWNRERIAYHRGWTSLRQWDKFPTQKSSVIRLEQGQTYYLEALVKEGTGGDHLSIGWHRIEGGALALSTWSAAQADFAPQADGTTNFTIASGDIWGTSDRGAFHHQTWSGDGIFTLEIARDSCDSQKSE